jgi:signal transduction histidine kinase
VGSFRGTRARLALPVVLAALAPGCREGPTGAAPSITIDQVPPADAGGTLRLSGIAGRAVGARPGQRVVLYARSGDWYVQPFADAPFTAIGPDSTWTSRTHLGTEYGALLVEPDFEAPAIVASLPGRGGRVAATRVVAGTPPFWRRRSFLVLVLGAAVAAGLALHVGRVRMLTRQLHLRAGERLAERTRIAQTLYDTLLQSLLGASLQLHTAVDGLPEDSPHRARFAAALATMGAAAQEGRRVLHALRGADADAETLEGALSRLGREAAGEERELNVSVVGPARPLHPIVREEVYGVCRDAVASAFRHARASTVDVELHYASRSFRVVVRDDGSGIGPDPASGGGLAAMRARAEAIGARLRVRSRSGGGTEVDLSIPRGVAYTAGAPAGD